MTKIIGITGGIASGKSSVTAFLRQEGYPVIDADQVVHDLQEVGGPLYRLLVERLGTGILMADGRLNRPAIAQRFFSDSSLKSWSDQAQGQLIRQELAAQRDWLAETEPILFMDIPLLFEQHYESWFDQIWLVYVDRETQLERLMLRNGLSQAEAEARLASQMPLEQKLALTPIHLDNSRSLEFTQEQVLARLRYLL